MNGAVTKWMQYMDHTTTSSVYAAELGEFAVAIRIALDVALDVHT